MENSQMEIILHQSEIPEDLREYFEPIQQPRGNVFRINTKPYKNAHCATFPPELIETPIRAGCPEFICSKCGKPREKIYKREDYQKHQTEAFDLATHGDGANRSKHSPPAENELIGYSDCGCGEPFKPGLILDIFSGSGTTLEVSLKLGRKSIGIDLSQKYCELTKKRPAQRGF